MRSTQRPRIGRTLSSVLGAVLALGLLAGPASAEVNSTFPSTNDINRTKEPVPWAHVDQVTVGIGTTDLQFVSSRAFDSCFEYRTDGDTTQKISQTNYNPAVTDGLYPYFCVNNGIDTRTIEADAYVEVRLAFGAESDERFDWTRFDVLPNDPHTRAECKNGGWATFGFRNQGQCIRYVNTGRDSR
jgi:hypothetical protein